MAAAATRILMRRPTAIFLNASRLDYDKALDFSRLQKITNLTVNSVDAMTDADEIASKQCRNNHHQRRFRPT